MRLVCIGSDWVQIVRGGIVDGTVEHPVSLLVAQDAGPAATGVVILIAGPEHDGLETLSLAE